MGRLTRSHIVEVTGGETYDDLAAAMVETAKPQRWPTKVPLADIQVADKVFQWRRSKRNQVQRQDHVWELARVLKATGETLDALLVLPVGDRFYVIDGHHRLSAYKTVDWKGAVPIRVFEGTLDEAVDAALALNSKNKLPLSKEDKQEAAWRCVRDGRLSIAETVQLTTVSDRQVSIMRRVLKTLRLRQEELSCDLSEMTWGQARAAAQGDPDYVPEDDWREREAQKIVDGLLKAKIGQGLMKHTDVTALALRMLNADLPAAMIQEWAWEERELIDELARAVNAPDDEAL